MWRVRVRAALVVVSTPALMGAQCCARERTVRGLDVDIQTAETDPEAVRRIWARLRPELPASMREQSQFWLGGRGYLAAGLRACNGKEDTVYDKARQLAKLRLAEDWPLRLGAGEVAGPLRTGMQRLMPGRDLAGRSVVVCTPRLLDPTVGTVADYQRMGGFLMQHLVEAGRDGGVALVADLRGFQWSWFSLADIRRGTQLADTLPCELGRVWVVSPDWVVRAVVTAALSVVTSKLRSRIVVLGCSEHELAMLRAEVGSARLPVELGGTVRLEEWPAALGRILEVEESGSREFRIADLGVESGQMPGG